MKVEIYSDIACPWCYIGKRRFERALASFPAADEVEVVFRPYQLDPAAPVQGTPLLPSLERKFGPRHRQMTAHVGEQARAEGLAFDWQIAIAANTFDAHRLLWLAEREGGTTLQHAVAEQLFDAHFSRGVDVGDRGQLAEVATRAGLDRDRVAAFLASGEGAAETRAAIDEARALGISGVPAFVFDERYLVSGAQPASVFLQALEQVTRETAAADACADDACAM